jgi:hypothetical protein
MNNLKTTAFALATTLPLFFMSTASQAAMAPSLEKALVKICVAAASNKPIQLKNAIDNYRLTEHKVALNVMCNNTDIIDFADQRGATKTAGRLQKSIGKVNIVDVAAISKINVTFEE